MKQNLTRAADVSPNPQAPRLRSISLHLLYCSREDKDSKSPGCPPAGYFFLDN